MQQLIKQKVVVARKEDCMFCGECVAHGESFKTPQNVVQVKQREDRFIFSVEVTLYSTFYFSNTFNKVLILMLFVVC